MEAAAKAEQTASPVGSRNEFSKQLDGFVGCVERFAAQKFAHPTQEEYNVDPNSRTFSATLAGQGPADGAQYPEHLRHSSDTRHSDAADVRQTNPKPSPAESGGLGVSFSRGRYEARCMEAEQPGAPRASLKARSSSSHDRSGRRKEDGGVRQTVRGPREEQHSQNTTQDRGEPCRSQDRSHRTETDAEGDCGKPARRIAKLWRLVSNEADLHDRVSVSSRRARIRVRLEDGGRIKDLVRDLRSVLRQLQAEHPHGFTPVRARSNRVQGSRIRVQNSKLQRELRGFRIQDGED